MCISDEERLDELEDDVYRISKELQELHRTVDTLFSLSSYLMMNSARKAGFGVRPDTQ